MGDVLDIGAGQGGHAPMIAGPTRPADLTGRPAPGAADDPAMAEEHTVRPMRLDDVEPAAEVMINGGWGDRAGSCASASNGRGFVPLVAEVDGGHRGHRRGDEQRAVSAGWA